MCKTRVQKARSVVRIEGALSSFFENKTGLKQGDPLSPILFNLVLQKVTKIGKEQLNILAYADDIALIGKKLNRNKTFCGNGKHCQKVQTTNKLIKEKVERKNSLKKNKIGHLKIKNYKFERVENFKYLVVILNKDNNNQIDLQERIKNANKTYFMLQHFFLK